MAQAGLTTTPVTIKEAVEQGDQMRAAGLTDPYAGYEPIGRTAPAAAPPAPAEEGGPISRPRSALIQGRDQIADNLRGWASVSGLDTLNSVADLIGPGEEALALDQDRQQDRADRLAAGEITDAQAFAGDVADIASAEALPMAQDIGMGWLFGKAAEKGVEKARGKDTKLKGKAKWLGRFVGAITSEYGNSYRESLAEGGVDPDADPDTIDDDTKSRAQNSAMVKSALNTILPLDFLKRVDPERATAIARQTVDKVMQVGKAGGAGAITEIATEAAEMAIDDLMMDPEGFTKLSQAELNQILPYIKERYGDTETIKGLLAAGVVGGGTGTVGGTAEAVQEAKTNADSVRMSEALSPLGMTSEKAQEIANEKEGVGKIQSAVSDIGKAETRYRLRTSQLEELKKADAEDPDVIEATREAAQEERDAVVDYHAKQLGLPMRSGDVNRREDDKAKEKASEAKKRLRAKGITDVDGDPDRLVEAADRIEQTATKVENLQDRADAIADPNRKQETEGELAEARDELRTAKIDALTDLKDVPRAQAIKQVDQQERREKQTIKRDQAVEKQLENEFPDDMSEGERRAKAEQIVASYNDDPTEDEKQLRKKIRRLEGQRRKAGTPETIDKLNDEIADLDSRIGMPTPAVEAARRVLQDLGTQDQAETGAVRPEDQPELAAAEDAVEAGLQAQPTAETETVAPSPTEEQARQTEVKRGVAKARGKKPVDLVPGAGQEGRTALLKTAQSLSKSAGDSNAEAKFGQQVLDAGYNAGREGKKDIPDKAKIGREAAVALAYADNATTGADNTALLEAGNVAAEDDPRRQGYDDVKPWDDLLDYVDEDGTLEHIESQLADWTADRGREAAAHFDAEGNLLGVGTNQLRYGVKAPRQGFGDPSVTFTHTHPIATPFSAADVRGMMIHTGPYRAVLPGGKVTAMRPKRLITRQTVGKLHQTILTASDSVLPQDMDVRSKARIRQEALLQHLEADGIIEYTEPFTGLTQEEQDYVAATLEGADAELRRQRNERKRTTPAGSDGGRDSRPVTEGPEKLAIPEARAERDARQVADPERVTALADLVYDHHLAQSKVGKPSNFVKALKDGEVSRDQMRRAMRVAVSGVGNKSNYVLRDVAYTLFPELKSNPEVMFEEGGRQATGYQLGKQLKPTKESGWKFSAALGMMEAVGTVSDQTQFFYHDPRWIKQNKTNKRIQAFHADANSALKSYLGYSGSPQSSLMPPMEDPDDTSQVIKHGDSAMTDAQLEPGKRTARYFQRNSYTINEDQLAKLTPEDLISGKGLAKKGIQPEDMAKYHDLRDQIDTGGVEKLSDSDQQWMKAKGYSISEQLRTAGRKLDRFRESVEEHKTQYPGEPVGFQYQIDNKGRIYADGDLNPQTSDAVKKMFMVDGVSLGEMTTVDNSASGWQVAALMARDDVLAPQINLGAGQAEIPGFQKQDMYNATIANLEARVREDAERTGKMNAAQKKNKKLAQLALDDIINPGLITRNTIKTPVIAVNYAATDKNFKDHFASAFAPLYPNGKSPPGLTNYLGNEARAALEQAAPHTMRMQNWAVDTIAKTVKAVEQNGINVDPIGNWTVGLNGTYKRRKTSKDNAEIRFRAMPGRFNKLDPTDPVQVGLERDEKGDPILDKLGERHITERIDVDSGEVDANATARSVYSQIIQGFDASILHRTVERYKAASDGAFITTNHDAFTGPNEHAGTMSSAARESMHQIMRSAGDVPMRIYQDAVKNLEAAGLTPEDVGITPPPAQGDYNLDDVLTSTPVFAEDADGNDVVPEYGDLPEQGAELVAAEDTYDSPELAQAIDVASYMEQPTSQNIFKQTQSFVANSMPVTSKFWESYERNMTNMLQPVRGLEKDVRKAEGKGSTMAQGTDSAFKAAEMAVNDSGRNESLLYYGAGKFGEFGEFTHATDTVGLGEIFKTASGGARNPQRLQHWFEYMVARRAKELKKRGIKSPITDAEIETALGRENEGFTKAADQWNTFNNANLQMLKDSGRITEPQMKAMQNDAFYVPFYRADQRVDGSSPDFDAPEFKGSGSNMVLARDPGIKTLKGGDKMRIANIGANMLQNSQAIVAAAMRNDAANRSFKLLETAQLVKSEVVSAKKPHKNAHKMWVDGKEKWIIPETDEAAMVLHSLGGMEPVSMDGLVRGLNVVSAMYRTATTMDPAFMLRNLWRGIKANALMTNGANLTLTSNTLTGLAKTLGTQLGVSDADSVREFKQISGMGDYRRGQPATGFGATDWLVDQGATGGGWGRLNPGYVSRLALRPLEGAGMATEFADRVAVYETYKRRGVRPDEAAYQALNLMNYSRKGGLPILRQLISTMPFMNARLQGYTRFFEGAVGTKSTPKTRAKAMTQLAGMALPYAVMNALAMAWNMQDEERWEEYADLPRWRKVLAINIVLPDGYPIKVLSLPQPFELGFIFGALPAAYVESSQPDLDHAFGETAWFIAKDTFAMNLIPQAFTPIMEAQANFDTFFGGPIETRREQSLEADLRVSNADNFARWLGAGTGFSKATGVSPAMISHWGDSYGGLLYSLVAGGFNTFGAEMGVVPPEAATPMGEGAYGKVMSKILSPFTFDTELARNRWSEEYYNAGNAATEQVRSFKETNEVDRLKGRGGAAGAYELFNSTNAEINTLGKEERRVKDDPDMPPKEKRERLKKIVKARNALFKASAQAMQAMMEEVDE